MVRIFSEGRFLRIKPAMAVLTIDVSPRWGFVPSMSLHPQLTLWATDLSLASPTVDSKIPGRAGPTWFDLQPTAAQCELIADFQLAIVDLLHRITRWIAFGFPSRVAARDLKPTA
jgi:hypothetical protein